MGITYQKLEQLYSKYNKREFVHPDPLEFLYNYQDAKDVEIAGLISSSLAYGNVKQILKSVSIALSKLSPSPYNYLINNNVERITKDFKGFKHRFTTEEHKVKLLNGIKNVLKEYGSLKNCFLANYNSHDINFLPAATIFTEKLNKFSKNLQSYLLPSPANGSACKRLMLFLRWMVRKDEIDPGCWNELPESKLIVPLDTHIYKIAKLYSLTKRKSADMKTAIEITENLKRINPTDPIKYDFALTRLGIRTELNYENLNPN